MSAKKPRGRKPVTGRFATRAELCAFVWREYTATDRSVPQIAAHAQVSQAVVHKIINTKEGHG
jgi:hypothetical protein